MVREVVGGGPRSISSEVEGIPCVLRGRSPPDVDNGDWTTVDSMCMLEGREVHVGPRELVSI